MTSESVPFLDLQKIVGRYREELLDAARDVIDSGWFLNGPVLSAFEKSVAERTGGFVVGVANGLDALTLLLQAYRIREGWTDETEVILPAQTFIATAEAVMRAGLTPVLCDIDATGTLGLDTWKTRLSSRTRAIVPVHLFGTPAAAVLQTDEMRAAGLTVIADGAQSHGAKVDAKNIASACFADATALSFYPGKNLGALGNGGAVVAHDEEIAKLVRTLANYGAERKYEHLYHGMNSRLEEMQAAFLDVRLRHLDEENARRREIATFYEAAIQNDVVTLPQKQRIAGHTFEPVHHIFPVLCKNRENLQAFLRDRRVDTLVHYPRAIHQQPPFKPFAGQSYPMAERFAAEELSLPISPVMTESQIRSVAEFVQSYAEHSGCDKQ